MIRRLLICLLVAGTLCYSCNNASFVSLRDTILLNGSWRFSMDTANAGIVDKWYAQLLNRFNLQQYREL